MAVLLSINNDSGVLATEWQGANQGSATLTSAAAFAGANGLRVAFVTDTVRSQTLSVFTNYYLKTALRVNKTADPSSQNDNIILMAPEDGPGASYGSIRMSVTTGGVITIYGRNDNTGTNYGSFTVTNGQWYTVELHIVVSTTVGFVEWRVDGNVITSSASNLNTQGAGSGPDRLLMSFAPFAANGMAGTIDYDEIVMDDAAYPFQGGITMGVGDSLGVGDLRYQQV